MLALASPIASLVNDRFHRFVSIWQITRTDGVVFRFTNHDMVIRRNEHDYTPMSSLNATAKQKIEGLKERNIDFRGVITSDLITYEDLLAGKFREARIDEALIDWRYPWAGTFAQFTYWVVSTRFSGEVWEAQVEGITHRLKISTGRVLGRTCDVKNFGDNRCKMDSTLFTWEGTVTAIDVPRKVFFTDEPDIIAKANNYFKYGTCRFISGLNDNIKMEVGEFTGGSGRIKLWLKMPYNIEIGDTFRIVAGCNRLLKTCRDKFDNVINFQGFPFIPGTDSMLKTPGYRPRE